MNASDSGREPIIPFCFHPSMHMSINNHSAMILINSLQLNICVLKASKLGGGKH